MAEIARGMNLTSKHFEKLYGLTGDQLRLKSVDANSSAGLKNGNQYARIHSEDLHWLRRIVRFFGISTEPRHAEYQNFRSVVSSSMQKHYGPEIARQAAKDIGLPLNWDKLDTPMSATQLRKLLRAADELQLEGVFDRQDGIGRGQRPKERKIGIERPPQRPVASCAPPPPPPGPAPTLEQATLMAKYPGRKESHSRSSVDDRASVGDRLSAPNSKAEPSGLKGHTWVRGRLYSATSSTTSTKMPYSEQNRQDWNDFKRYEAQPYLAGPNETDFQSINRSRLQRADDLMDRFVKDNPRPLADPDFQTFLAIAKIESEEKQRVRELTLKNNLPTD